MTYIQNNGKQIAREARDQVSNERLAAEWYKKTWLEENKKSFMERFLYQPKLGKG